MSEETRILLADDHAMMRKGLQVLIDQENSLRVIGEAGNGREAIEQVRSLQPDLVVMDINMPEVNGIEATRTILSEAPQTRILALSIHSDKRYVEEMLQAGVSGYLLKESAPEELITAISTVKDGKSYLSADITGIVLSSFREGGADTASGSEISENGSQTDKWIRPDLSPSVVHRRELIERLDQSRKKMLTLIVGPSGYGKSTLVSDWLADSKSAYAWWSVDQNDNDLKRFLQGWLTATGVQSETGGKYLSPLVETDELPPASILAGAMIADLEARSQPLTLVLDNMHLVTDQSIYNLLSLILKQPIKSMHLVLVSRVDPFLPIIAMRSGNLIEEIRMDDLKFSTGEIAIFLENALARPVAPEIAEEWESRTEGWVAGLQLAVHTLGGGEEVNADMPVQQDVVNWRSVLTNREYEILMLLQQRMRDKEIADQLCISPETVKTHLKNIYGKLHATDRRDAVVKAEELDILS